MIKAVVLSPSYNYYTLYIRNKRLNPYEYPYYIPNSPEKIKGLSRDIPFYCLEGWSENKYTVEDIKFITSRFTIKELSKGWVENEGIIF